MQVRWTDTAADDLKDAVDFIALSNTSAAQRVAHVIYLACDALASFPHRGRLGIEPGTREMVLAESGHIVTYEVILDAVFILRIHHGSQDWPRR